MRPWVSWQNFGLKQFRLIFLSLHSVFRMMYRSQTFGNLCKSLLRPQILRLAPPRTGSPGPFGAWNPGRVQKESGKSTPGQGTKSPERVRPGVSKESEKSLKPDLWTVSDFFEAPGRTLSGLLGPFPTVLFPDFFLDSSRVPGPEGPRRPCVGRGQLDPKSPQTTAIGEFPGKPSNVPNCHGIHTEFL